MKNADKNLIGVSEVRAVKPGTTFGKNKHAVTAAMLPPEKLAFDAVLFDVKRRVILFVKWNSSSVEATEDIFA